MNIFFDLDGTLLDSKARLYQLFQSLVPKSNYTFDDYWNLKQSKISHQKILTDYYSYSAQEFNSFQTLWMGKIETDEWLALDEPFDGIVAYLTKLEKSHQLYIVTARQFEEVAYQQVQKMGIDSLIDKVLVTNQTKEKHELIKETVAVTNLDWMVGDTGKDIETGKLLGMKTAAVLSGFLNEKSLLAYKPDIIAASVLDLKF